MSFKFNLFLPGRPQQAEAEGSAAEERGSLLDPGERGFPLQEGRHLLRRRRQHLRLEALLRVETHQNPFPLPGWSRHKDWPLVSDCT